MADPKEGWLPFSVRSGALPLDVPDRIRRLHQMYVFAINQEEPFVMISIEDLALLLVLASLGMEQP